MAFRVFYPTKEAGYNVNYVGAKVWYSTSYTTGLIGFNNEVFDTHNFHSNTTNPSRLTIPPGYKDAFWRLTFSCRYDYSGTSRYMKFYKNGSGLSRQHDGAISSSYQSTSVSATYQGSSGDYFEVYIGDVNIVNGATLDDDNCPLFSIELIGR